MSYNFLPHTADARMEAEGESLEAVFTDSLKGMLAFMRPRALSRAEKFKRHIAVSSGDTTSLLVDFLNEVLNLAQTNKETYERVSFTDISETSLSAVVIGTGVESFGEDIKAVTYHEADVRRDESGRWHARLIFDI